MSSLSRVFGIGTVDAESGLRGVEKLRRAGKLDRAIAELEKLLAKDPNDVTVRSKLAEVLAESGDRDRALSGYVKVQEQLADQGDLLGAISAGLKVIELDPKFENPLAYVAKIKLDSLREEQQRTIPSTATAAPEEPGGPPAETSSVAAIPFLSDLDPDELESVAATMRRHELSEDIVVFQEGDAGDSLYFVRSGLLEARARGATLGLLESGQCFGEFSFLTQRPRAATVSTLERCEVLELSAAGMRQVVANHPRVKDVLFEMYRDRALVNVLSQSPLFVLLPVEERRRLAPQFGLVRVPKGVAAIQEGQHDGTLYLIKKGSVSVRARLHGELMTLAKLEAHQFFGEVSFLTGVPRTASVHAEEDTELLQIGQSELSRLLEQYPGMTEVLEKSHLDRVTATAETLKAFLRRERVDGGIVS